MKKSLTCVLAILAVAFMICGASAACTSCAEPLTKGYWSTHPEHISDIIGDGIWLGGGFGPKSIHVTSADQAVTILKIDDASNGIDKLYAQELATKLNIFNGADASGMWDIIWEVDCFLTHHNSADWNSLSEDQKQMVINWALIFDNYNNNLN